MVKSYQDFSLRFFRSNLLYFFFYAIFIIFENQPYYYLTQIYFIKKYKIHRTNILSIFFWLNDRIYYFLN